MLESHARQTQQQRNEQWKKTRGDKAEVPPWDGQQEITGGGGLQLVFGRPTLALNFALVPQILS